MEPGYIIVLGGDMSSAAATGTPGPPGHFYVSVASRMVIPQTLNIEQVAIILMKAKKALQQLQFQWVILNRPACTTHYIFDFVDFLIGD